MIWALALITTKHVPPVASAVREAQWRKLAAGLFYVIKRRDLLVVFAMVFFVGTFSMHLSVMSAAMAVYFGRGAGDYGLLNSIVAIGSLVGALLVARRPDARIIHVIIAAAALGVAAIIAAGMPIFWLFAAMHVFFGFASSTLFTTANGYVQMTAAPEVRGRVLALYMAIVMGGTPIGAPLVGAAADTFGAPSTYLISGVGALVAFGVGMWWIASERKRALAGLPPAGVELDVERLPSAAGDPLPVTEDAILVDTNSVPLEGVPTTGVIHLPYLLPEEDSAEGTEDAPER